MLNNKSGTGHLAALICILIWGTTFISTKVLLNSFSPVEILFFRFFIGYLALWVASPRRMAVTNRKHELYFAAAGLCGVTLYFLMENFALQFTMASNVGVIISIAPFFTAIFSFFFLKGERPDVRFFVGFVTAIAGIALIGFNSESTLQINPAGDVLAVLAAIVWAAYSTIIKKISGFGYSTVGTTRRTFFYGLVCMVPALFLFGFKPDLARFADMQTLLNVLFLGLLASAACFVIWNFAVKVLGSVKTSVYIYMVPVVTVVTSILVLHEQITAVAVCGIVLTVMGLVISESRFKLRKKNK